MFGGGESWGGMIMLGNFDGWWWVVVFVGGWLMVFGGGKWVGEGWFVVVIGVGGGVWWPGVSE